MQCPVVALTARLVASRATRWYSTSVSEDPTTSTVRRVFAVLSAIADESGESQELAVTDIARAVGRERSQVSRMLKSLAACGLVEQDAATRAYRLGWQLYALAASSGDQRLLALGRPVLADLSAQTGEVALLSVLRGSRVLTVLRQDSPRLLQAGGWVGLTSPLHVTAAGRALLFDYPDAQVGQLVRDDIGRDAFGPRAPAACVSWPPGASRSEGKGARSPSMSWRPALHPSPCLCAMRRASSWPRSARPDHHHG